MANTKNKPKKHNSSLPKHFASLEEAGDFWDVNDSADYEEYLQDVEYEVDIKQRMYLVSLDGDLFRRVSTIARDKGIAPETLVNLWVQEKAS